MTLTVLASQFSAGTKLDFIHQGTSTQWYLGKISKPLMNALCACALVPRSFAARRPIAALPASAAMRAIPSKGLKRFSATYYRTIAVEAQVFYK